MQEYNLKEKVVNDHIYMKIIRGMYGLPQAGRLANNLLKQRLSKYSYYETNTTPGLWKHTFRPIYFTLIVDDFGIKFTNIKNTMHLIKTLKKWYEIEVDWTGSRYAGITLKWDYQNRFVDITLPNYTKNKLKELNFESDKKRDSPHPGPTLAKNSQKPINFNESPRITPERIKRIQKIIGVFLYSARAVDVTIIKTLNSLASQQNTATERTEQLIKHFLEYLSTHPDPKIRYFSSDIILSAHSNASYINELGAKSTAAGYFWLKNKKDKDTYMKKNGAIHVLSKIIKLVCSSTAESELAALFMNAKQAIPMRQTLIDLDHKQPLVDIITDNSIAAGIVNQTMKQNKSRVMNMRYF